MSEMEERIRQIRESEKQSHIALYSNEQLYQTDSWLKKPIKTIQELLPEFKEYEDLRILDLGCGVGRNCICIAQEYRGINCRIDCVDILDYAIQKLRENALHYGVFSNIHEFVEPIETYEIQPSQYDFIIAVSALEHVDTEESFVRKLAEIRDGIRGNGIVCLVMNSDVRETDCETGTLMPTQFEVNLPTEKLQGILHQIFSGWSIMKSTVLNQRYTIPRGNRTSRLETTVVTFVARVKRVAKDPRA